MANADIIYTPDPDAESISSDVAEYNGVLVTTQIPTHADGSLELGGIVEQSECTLQALKVALEKAGSGMDRVLHLTIYITDMADRAAFNEWQRAFGRLLDCAAGDATDADCIAGWQADAGRLLPGESERAQAAALLGYYLPAVLRNADTAARCRVPPPAA